MRLPDNPIHIHQPDTKQTPLHHTLCNAVADVELLVTFVDVLLWRFNGLAYAAVSDDLNGGNTRARPVFPVFA